MTRYVITPDVALRLAREAVEVADEHKLVAPTLLRSEVLDTLYAGARAGDLTREDADEYLTHIRGLRIRLLGDRVLQWRAWAVADQLGWGSTLQAEYIALTLLQADALVTLDDDLAAAAAALVTVADFTDLS